MSYGLINKPSGQQPTPARLPGWVQPRHHGSNHPHCHCPQCGSEGATWAQSLPLQRLAWVAGNTRASQSIQHPSCTKSSHSCYCRHILHQRPFPVLGAVHTLCPGDSHGLEPPLPERRKEKSPPSFHPPHPQQCGLEVKPASIRMPAFTSQICYLLRDLGQQT